MKCGFGLVEPWFGVREMIVDRYDAEGEGAEAFGAEVVFEMRGFEDLVELEIGLF